MGLGERTVAKNAEKKKTVKRPEFNNNNNNNLFALHYKLQVTVTGRPK